MSSITVLGLGSMGSRMAVNFAAAGHEVTVWNRTTARADHLATDHGLTVAATPRLAAERADFIVSMVADDQAARDVWLDDSNGALVGMSNSAIGIESSTLTPVVTRELADAAAAVGLSFVAAPVVGSRPQAEQGVLLTILGGEASAVSRVAEVIEVNSGVVKHVGDVGDAAAMKLAVNGLFAAQVAAYSEVVGFLERTTVDTGNAIDLLAALPITSPGLQRILGLISDRSYEPNFPVQLVAKDLRYLALTANEVGAQVPLIDAAAKVFSTGANGAQSDLDIAGIASVYLE